MGVQQVADLQERLDQIYAALIALGMLPSLEQRLYPANSGVATITGGAANLYGAWQEILSAAQMTQQMYLVGFEGEFDAADIYTVEIGVGAIASEVGICEFGWEPQNADETAKLDCWPQLLESGVRVAARLKTTGGGNKTISNSKIIVRHL